MTMTRTRAVLLWPVLLISVAWLAGARVAAQTTESARSAIVFDTGVVTLGPTQVLYVTVTNIGDRGVRVRAGFMDYTDDSCLAFVSCLQEVLRVAAGPVETLAPNQARSWKTDAEVPSRRVQIRVNGRNPLVRVNSYIIDTTTGLKTEWITS